MLQFDSQKISDLKGFRGPGPGSQTRVFRQIGPADPGPMRPGVFGIPNFDKRFYDGFNIMY